MPPAPKGEGIIKYMLVKGTPQSIVYKIFITYFIVCLGEQDTFKCVREFKALKIKYHQFANFVITGGTISCHNDNLWCHQWWQSRQTDNLLFSEKSDWCSAYTIALLHTISHHFYHVITESNHVLLGVHPEVKTPILCPNHFGKWYVINQTATRRKSNLM